MSDKRCEKCGLYKTCVTPCMDSHGADNPVVLVIGEAPGEQEDKEGVPFVGRSGRHLRSALEEFFDVDGDIRFTNVVRCRPPNNKISKRAINCCVPLVLEEIERYNPDLVLLMGNSPLNAILGESGITTWNGVVIERQDRLYVPLYHPAYILRNRSATDDWLEGFFRAEEALKGRSTRLEVEYIYPKTLTDVDDMLDWLLSAKHIAFDTETSSLDAYDDDSAVIAVSFATKDRAYALPLFHPDTWWTDYELYHIVAGIAELLDRDWMQVIGHNVKFDQTQWSACTRLPFDAYGDTMLLSHLLDSRRGVHSLKRLAGIHLGMYDYDSTLTYYLRENLETDPKKGGTYAKVPLDILLPYAAMDAAATMALHIKFEPELSVKQRRLYNQLVMPASNALARMESNGFALDLYIAHRYAQIYSMYQSELYDEIMCHGDVQRFVQDRQHALNEQRAGKKRQVFTFNPNSTPQLRELYYDYCDVPVPSEHTATGLSTTKSSALRPYEQEYTIVGLMRQYKLMTKVLGTYLKPAASGAWSSARDDRVRANYNLHGTVTGRLSSSNPNLQNIPVSDKFPGTLLDTLPVRNIFTHTHQGGHLVSFDYAGMELRVVSSLADCTPMLDMWDDDRDFHTMVASTISGIPYDNVDKRTRSLYKWASFAMLYGGGASTLSRDGIPKDAAKDIFHSYYDRFPELRKWQDDVIDFVRDTGYAESPFGRREYLPYIRDRDTKRAAEARRQAINMPVQSAASDITLAALVLIDQALRDQDMRSMIVSTVHDSIVVDVHPYEIYTVAVMCVAIMEDIANHMNFYMPDVDMSWLKCPLKVDIEVGTHYGVCEKQELADLIVGDVSG